MSFSKMVELLQNKDKGYIILVNIGQFYVARGKDAVLLHHALNLKTTCMETEICKVGFPITSLEKYTKLIEELQYSYIVYNFNSKEEKLEKIKEYKGKKLNLEKEERLNCYICQNTVKKYKKHDKYTQAVANLYKEDMEARKTEENTEKTKKKNRRTKWKLGQKKKTN